MGHPWALFNLFSSFQTNITILTTKICEYFLRPSVYGAGIRTQDLRNTTLLSKPLDRGSRPSKQRLEARRRSGCNIFELKLIKLVVDSFLMGMTYDPKLTVLPTMRSVKNFTS